MRIFVGIPVSEEIKGRILQWRNKIQDPRTKNQINFQFPIPNSQMRWVEPKNLHVTLVPPLDFARGLRPADVEEIIKKLNGVKFNSFTINFNKIELGPNDHEPRMVWLSGNATNELNDLKKLIEKSLNESALIKHGRAFYQHMTLARFKAGDTASFKQNDLPTPIDWSMSVEKFVLYRSHLLPQGSDYEVLEEFPLG